MATAGRKRGERSEAGEGGGGKDVYRWEWCSTQRREDAGLSQACALKNRQG